MMFDDATTKAVVRSGSGSTSSTLLDLRLSVPVSLSLSVSDIGTNKQTTTSHLYPNIAFEYYIRLTAFFPGQPG